MKILRYKKIKDNMYEIYLDNGSILKFYDDTIIKYSLLLKKTLDHRELEEITKYNDEQKAYYISLKHLNKKMRSHLEIKNFLSRNEFPDKIIKDTIKKLENDGYLNNNRYIESYISDQLALTMNGPEKIKANLIKLGFQEEKIIIEYDFNDKIKSLIDKKVKLNRKDNTITLKMKISSYLSNLGYSKEMFINYLENIKVNDNMLIKKDYEQLIKKYQKKYEPKKLKLFIRDKLYKKGYNIDEINEVISDEY